MFDFDFNLFGKDEQQPDVVPEAQVNVAEEMSPVGTAFTTAFDVSYATMGQQGTGFGTENYGIGETNPFSVAPDQMGSVAAGAQKGSLAGTIVDAGVGAATGSFWYSMGAKALGTVGKALLGSNEPAPMMPAPGAFRGTGPQITADEIKSTFSKYQ